MTANCAFGRVLRVRCCWDRLWFILDVSKNECQLKSMRAGRHRYPDTTSPGPVTRLCRHAAPGLAVDCRDWPVAYPHNCNERAVSCFSNGIGGVISTPVSAARAA